MRRTYSGHALDILIADNLAAGWYDRDRPVDPEIDFLKSSRLTAGARVFDLGGHQGVFAMILSKEVGNAGEVICVEGSAHNAAVAELNVRANNIKNLRVLHAVVDSHHDKPIPFRQFLNGQVDANASGREDVNSVSIDYLASVFGRPDVIVVDIEGYELNALKGAPMTLECSADWLIEVHAGCGIESFGSVDEIFEFFPEKLFELFIAAGESENFVEFTIGDLCPGEKFFLCARSR